MHYAIRSTILRIVKACGQGVAIRIGREPRLDRQIFLNGFVCTKVAGAKTVGKKNAAN